MLALPELRQRLGDGDTAVRGRLRDDHVGVLGARGGQRPGQVGRVRSKADHGRLDPRRLEAGLLDLRPVVDSRDLHVDDRSRLGLQDVLAERAPRPEHRVVRPEQREAVLALRVDRQQLDAADRGLLVAEGGVERLVADGDGTELDDLDPLVVGELLAALRALFLRGRGEAVADHERVALDAAQVAIDVLDGRPDSVRPAGSDQDLASLRVDRADDDRRQPRVGLALTADIDVVVRDRAPGRARAERDRDGDGERDGDGAEDDRQPSKRSSGCRPHSPSLICGRRSSRARSARS